MTSTAANAAIKLASEMAKSEGSVYESGLYSAIRDMVAAIAQETGIDHRQFSVDLSVPSAARKDPASFGMSTEIDGVVYELYYEYHRFGYDEMQDDDQFCAPRCDGTGWVGFVHTDDNTEAVDGDTAKTVDGWVAEVKAAVPVTAPTERRTVNNPYLEIARACSAANGVLAWLMATDPVEAWRHGGGPARTAANQGIAWLMAIELAKYPGMGILAITTDNDSAVIIRPRSSPPKGPRRNFRITPYTDGPSEDHGWLIADIDDPNHQTVTSTFDGAFELAVSSTGERW